MQHILRSNSWLMAFALLIATAGFISIAQLPDPPTGVLSVHHRSLQETDEAVSFFPELAPFYHGVASGDPLADRVIIWTRVTPPVMNGADIEVAWRMATDPALQNVVAFGDYTATESADYTVKIDVVGLESGSTFYYGFSALGANSLTGRTKTTPTAAESDHLKFGVVSCSNYQAGYFNAYGRLAERNDLDAIIHLGDYIYEYANGVYGNEGLFSERSVLPDAEIIDLFDYRTRYGTYRLDTQLLRLHQQHPIIAVWDDHETANDSYANGASNHNPATEGPWSVRESNARRAYFEWMPIRDNADTSVYRNVSYGNLADLIMIDTRLEGRDEQINDITDSTLYDEDRTLLGTEQREWLFDQLDNSTAKWKIMGQQIIFSPFNVGWAGSGLGMTFEETESMFLDIWDGYPAERRRVIDHLTEEALDNVVILTGDFHSSFAFDVVDPPVNFELVDIPNVGVFPFYETDAGYDPVTGAGSVAVEFATPSVTSANFDENVSATVALAVQNQINVPILAGGGTFNLGNPNPHLKFVDLINHGYFILDVTDEKVQADYFYTPILTEEDDNDFAGGPFSQDGNNHLELSDVPAPPKAIQDTPAPANPPPFITANAPVANASLRVLAIFPNPARARVNLNFSLLKAGRLSIDLVDSQGRKVRSSYSGKTPAGLFSLEQELTDLPTGQYFFKISLEGELPMMQPVTVQ